MKSRSQARTASYEGLQREGRRKERKFVFSQKINIQNALHEPVPPLTKLIFSPQAHHPPIRKPIYRYSKEADFRMYTQNERTYRQK